MNWYFVTGVLAAGQPVTFYASPAVAMLVFQTVANNSGQSGGAQLYVWSSNAWQPTLPG